MKFVPIILLLNAVGRNVGAIRKEFEITVGRHYFYHFSVSFPISLLLRRRRLFIICIIYSFEEIRSTVAPFSFSDRSLEL